jgi:peptidoglycan/LPS O-acetylase OafA/YrhL
MTFIRELKRRNVFRVAAAYAVVAWLIAQVAELALDSFGAPDWVIRTVLFLLFAGFPLALVFAWAFELTPEGIRRDSSDVRDDRKPTPGMRILDGVIIAALIITAGYFGYDRLISGDAGDRVEPGEDRSSPAK